MLTGFTRKLIFYLTLTVLIVEGGFAILNIDSQEKQLLDEMTIGAEMVSQTMVSTTWHAMLEDRRETVYEMMENVGRQENIDKVRIYNKTGRIMFSTAQERVRAVDIRAEACDVCHAAGQPLVQVDTPSRTRIFRREGGGRLMGMVTPIYNEPSCSTADCHAHPENIHVLGVLDVTMPLDRVDAELAGLRLRSFLLSTVSVLLVSFFVILFTRRFVHRPVQQLIAATKAIGVLDVERPLDLCAEGELGELAASFRRMQDRLRSSHMQIRNFTLTLEKKVAERTAQLRATEQKLIQSDRLASLGQLSASVAHEINNPLAGVINFGKLMQRIMGEGNVPPERQADFRTYLDHIVTETSRCGNIVRDLLVFARHQQPSREPHDFNEIVRRTLAVIHHRLELGEVEAKLELAEDLPEVVCDASQMQQIVINLVLNAAEAMEAGFVTIRTAGEAGGRRVRLEVCDTGSGIDPEHLDRIYDPFFSTKAEGQGTGLGLAVVYGIVNAHGGQIEVQSEIGRGTVFTVLLPVEAGTGQAATGAIPASGASPGSSGSS